jgi:hypothetical protein
MFHHENKRFKSNKILYIYCYRVFSFFPEYLIYLNVVLIQQVLLSAQLYVSQGCAYTNIAVLKQLTKYYYF